MPIAYAFAEFPPRIAPERRNAQLEQFVMIQRGVDFRVQIIGQTFLPDDDDRLQPEPMPLGAQAPDLSAG